MIVPIRYADSVYELDLPDKNLAGLIEPSKPEPLDLDMALENNKLPDNLISGSFRILVIINDAFRGTPSYLILDKILPELEQNNQVKIIIATGLHERPSEEEFKNLIGKHYERHSNSVYWSDSKDFDSFQQAARWYDGGDIYLHKLFFWAEWVIVIGSVEPHYFAGFTGGIKSIMPGLAYYKTIEHNHQKAIDPNAQPGETFGNPVWEELWETTRLIDTEKVFSYQIVQDSRREIIGLFSGSLEDSYHKAVEFSGKIYIKTIENRCDLLIAEHSPPLDRNLYQLQKSFENTKDGVKDGGGLMIFSACDEGIGTQAFYDLAAKYPHSNLLLDRPIEGYNLGIHKLYRTALLTNRVNLYLISNLPEDTVRRVYLKPVRDANEMIKGLLTRNPEMRIIVVKDAGHTVIKTLL